MLKFCTPKIVDIDKTSVEATVVFIKYQRSPNLNFSLLLKKGLKFEKC